MSCTKMDRPSDIEVLCRLCLVKDQVHIPIFEEQGDIRQIFLKISCCLPVSISREDNLPKKICDNCSNKLDSLYEFWNTSVNAEKTLLSWLGQAGVKYTDNAISAVVQQITKPETEIKIEDETFEDGEVEPIEINDKDDEAEEIDDGEMEDFDDGEVEDIEDDEPPPPKRARRSAALKAQETLANISDDDEDEEFDTAELVTEVKEESDESEGEVKDPSILNAVPGTSANDQPGPSGLGKNGPDAPHYNSSREHILDVGDYQIVLQEEPLELKEEDFFVDNQTSETISNKEKNEETVEITYVDVERFNCNICNAPFVSRNSLKGHMTWHLQRKVKCAICNTFFKCRYSLNMHIQEIHSVIKPSRLEHRKFFKCHDCGKTGLHERSLVRHIATYHSTQKIKFGCHICGMLYNQKHHLNQHVMKHRLPIVKHASLDNVNKHKSIACIHCGGSFENSLDLGRHLRTQHPLFKKEWEKAPLTNFKTLRSESVYKSIDNKRVNIACEFCEASFENRLDLDRHVGTNHPLIKEECDEALDEHDATKVDYNHPCRLICELCNDSFINKDALERHIKIEHSWFKKDCDEAPIAKQINQSETHISEICEGSFITKSGLGKYMKRNHPPKVECDNSALNSVKKNQQEKLTCHVCNESFEFLYLLRAHVLAHDVQEEFQCDVCAKTFITENQLNLHRLSHSNYFKKKPQVRYS